MKVTVTRDRIYCDVKPVFSRGSKYIYMYIEEPWVYTYAYIANNYWLLVVVLCAALAVCGGILVSLRRERKRAAARDDTGPA